MSLLIKPILFISYLITLKDLHFFFRIYAEHLIFSMHQLSSFSILNRFFVFFALFHWEIVDVIAFVVVIRLLLT